MFIIIQVLDLARNLIHLLFYCMVGVTEARRLLSPGTPYWKAVKRLYVPDLKEVSVTPKRVIKACIMVN